MKILLTAFEPFGGESVNAAAEAVCLVRAPEGVTLRRCIVPTVFSDCIRSVRTLLETESFDAIVSVGQAAGRAAITPERIAVNIRDARIPDNAGFCPNGEPVEPDGPATYFSTLPILVLRDAIRAAGVASEISNTAGTFVCNDLMYGILHTAATEGLAARCGFIHVPCTPEQANAHTPPIASMPLDDIVKGLEAALAALQANP